MDFSGDLNAAELRVLLGRLSGGDFVMSREKPPGAVFAMKNNNVIFSRRLELEWAVKNTAGIIILTEPYLSMDMRDIPPEDSCSRYQREEAIREAREQFHELAQNMRGRIARINTQFGSNIVTDDTDTQRLIAHAANNDPVEKLINEIAATKVILQSIRVSA